MRYVFALLVIMLAVLTVGTGMFVVDQRQSAIIFGMGEMKDVIENRACISNCRPLSRTCFFWTSVSSRRKRMNPTGSSRLKK